MPLLIYTRMLSRMRIATVNRPPEPLGGDEIQRRYLARELAALGVEVVHAHTGAAITRLPCVDLIHTYNLHLPTTELAAREARHRRIPLVISPIVNPGIHYPAWALDVVRQSRLILGNSQQTATHLQRVLGCPGEEIASKCVWLPVGIDHEWLQETEGSINDIATPIPIICVGRLEPRKRQLALLETIQRKDPDILGEYGLVFVGRCSPTEKKQYLHFPNVVLAGERSHEDVRWLLHNAWVHVLPTQYDNPGLVNLEAAVCGCEVVTTDLPDIRDYLGSYPYYVQHLEEFVPKIREALEASRRRQGDTTPPPMAKMLARRFSWENVAARLVEYYERALGQ